MPKYYNAYLKTSPPLGWQRGGNPELGGKRYLSHENIKDAGTNDPKAQEEPGKFVIRRAGKKILHPLDEETANHFIRQGIIDKFEGDVPPLWDEVHNPANRTARHTQRLRDRVRMGNATVAERAELERREGTGLLIHPAARRLADEYNLTNQDLDEIEGSGAKGRILKKDIEVYIEARD